MGRRLTLSSYGPIYPPQSVNPSVSLFPLAAPQCVNSASWPLRQILPANRRLVSVSSTQLPREKEGAADRLEHARGGCTKTRRLQEGFFRIHRRRHHASSSPCRLPTRSFHRAVCMNSVIARRITPPPPQSGSASLPHLNTWRVRSGPALPSKGARRERTNERYRTKGRVEF